MFGVIRLVANSKAKGPEAVAYWHVIVIDPSISSVESLLLTDRELRAGSHRAARNPEDCNTPGLLARLLAWLLR